MLNKSAAKVAIAGYLFPSVSDYLQASMPEVQIVRVKSEDLAAGVRDADVLLPSMYRINQPILAAAPGLRLVQQWGAGLEGVDQEAASHLGIAVANVPTQGTGNAESVAEWCVMAAIAIGRQASVLFKNLQEGRAWGDPCGQSLLGKTAGIVGLGGIGKPLAERLRPFKMRMVGVTLDPQDFNKEEYGLDWVGGMDDLPRLLAVSDYVFLCLPLTKETREIIGSRELAMMPRGSYLINGARGGLVNREALFASIDNQHLAGVALDVFWEEPTAAGDPDLARPQVFATPHIAGVTDVSYGTIAQRVAENIRRVMQGQLPLNCANPEVEMTPEWKARITR